MITLNDVSRGEFPWSAETVEVINSNADFTKQTLKGLQIGLRSTAVVLSGTKPPYRMYLSISPDNTNNTITKVTTKIPLNDPDYPTADKLLRVMPSNYDLINISTYVDINKEGDPNNVYERAIHMEEYEIVKRAGDAGHSFTFVGLRDVMDAPRWEQIDLSTLVIPQGLSIDTANSHIWVNANKNKIDICLHVNHTSSFLVPVSIQIPFNFSWLSPFPQRILPAAVGNFGTQTQVLPAWIQGQAGSMNITIDYTPRGASYTQAKTIVSGNFEMGMLFL